MQYYTLKDVAEKLSIDKTTVKKLIVMGKLQAINFGTGKRNIYRITDEALNNFSNQKTNGNSTNAEGV